MVVKSRWVDVGKAAAAAAARKSEEFENRAPFGTSAPAAFRPLHHLHHRYGGTSNVDTLAAVIGSLDAKDRELELKR